MQRQPVHNVLAFPSDDFYEETTNNYSNKKMWNCENTLNIPTSILSRDYAPSERQGEAVVFKAINFDFR